MKVSVESRRLAAALQNSLADKTSPLPIFEHVLLEADGDHLTVTSCDGARELVATIEAEVHTPGSTTAHSRKLKAAATMDGGITLARESNAVPDLKVSQGRRRFSVMALSPRDYPTGPKFDDDKPPTRVPVSAMELAEAISRVQYAAGKGDVRQYLNGVCVRSADVVATDGHRMSVFTMSAASKKDILIPRDSLKLLLTALREDDAVVMMDDSCLEVQHAAGRFRTQMIDGRYPDYKQLLRVQEGVPEVRVLPGTLLQSLGRVSAFVGQHRMARIEYQDGSLAIYADKTDDTFDLVPAELTGGEWPDFGINVDYLSELAHAIGKPFRWVCPGPVTGQFFFSDDQRVVDVIQPARL